MSTPRAPIRRSRFRIRHLCIVIGVVALACWIFRPGKGLLAGNQPYWEDTLRVAVLVILTWGTMLSVLYRISRPPPAGTDAKRDPNQTEDHGGS